MIEETPCLLVATEFPPNGSGGGAAIVRQMLSDWPAERLYWWSCAPDDDLRFHRSVAGHSVAKIPRKLVPHYRLVKPKTWIIEHLWVPWATHHLRATIASVQPDVIWAIPHGRAIRPMASVLPTSNTGVHVSIHDYPDDLRAVKLLGETRCRNIAKLVDLCYARATTRDAISESMVEDLKNRTGAVGNVSHAGLEAADLGYLAVRKEKTSDKIRIAFVGSINAETTFEIFTEAIAAIRSRLPKPVSMEIFSAHSYAGRPWFDPSWMHERGNLTEPEFTRALRECDWGFSPMFFNEDDPRHRFSLSTKFVSYLSAGLPIITMGHPEAGVVQLASKYNVGLCLTTGDPIHVRENIFSALSLPNPWEIFGAEISRCAHREFDAEKLRSRLHAQFDLCAQKTMAARA